jgi:hypothetical protein
VSEPEKSVWEQALDLVVFAPAGAFFHALDQLPERAAEGRARLGLQLSNAKVVGRFSLNHGRRRLERRLRPPERSAERVRPARAPGPGPVPRSAGPVPDPSVVDAVIPGYDTLSASQVVRRLEGLGPEELEAVRRYEAAVRGRRTVLHRAQQLLDGPAPAAPEA